MFNFDLLFKNSSKKKYSIQNFNCVTTHVSGVTFLIFQKKKPSLCQTVKPLDIPKVSNQLMDYVIVSKNPLNINEMKLKIKSKKKCQVVYQFLSLV